MNYPTVEELLKDPKGELDKIYNKGLEDATEAIKGYVSEYPIGHLRAQLADIYDKIDRLKKINDKG
jgi:hypothetical protein